MSATGWMPVDESVSKWTPVEESTKPAAPYSAVTEGAQPFIGAAKGLGSSVYGASNLVNKGIRAVGHGVGLGAATDKYVPPFPTQKPDYLAPQTTGQKIGYGAEQMGEFALPGGAISKAGKGIDAAVDAYRVAPFLKSALKLGGKSALEGASTAGVTAAQGGDVGTNAAIGAATPFASAALKPVGEFTDAMASKIGTRILKPPDSATTFGKEPGRVFQDEGIVAGTNRGIKRKINQKLAERSSELDTALAQPQNANNPVDIASAVNGPIDKYVKDAKDMGNHSLASALEDMRQGLLNKSVSRNGAQYPVSSSSLPIDAVDLKRFIGANTKWSPDAVQQGLNSAKSKIYGSLDSAVDTAVPETEQLNQRLSNLIGAKKSISGEIKRADKRDAVGLFDRLAMLGSGAAGFAHGGGSIPEAALFAGGAYAAHKAFTSPLARTLEIKALAGVDSPTSRALARTGRNALLGRKALFSFPDSSEESGQ